MKSDLKAFGFMHTFLILEYHIDVKHLHIALYCDNTLTMS